MMQHNTFNAMIANISRLFMSATERQRHDFDTLQRTINGAFAETQPIRRRFDRAENDRVLADAELGAAEAERTQFVMEHPEASEPNYVRQRRLMVYGPVFIEVILGYKCMNETFRVLGLDLEMLPVALLSVVVTLLFLSLAVGLRNKYLAYQQSKKHSLVDKILFLIPLLVLPCMAVATITSTGSTQVQWVVGMLACVTFLLNLAVARYSRVLQLQAELQILDKRLDGLRAKSQKGTATVERLREDMNSRLPRLIDLATLLQQMVQLMPTPPKERDYSILLPYRFVMNRRIYFNDILPIPAISITNPDGDVKEFSDFWDNAIGFGQGARRNDETTNVVEETSPSQLGAMPAFANSDNGTEDQF